MDFAELLQSQQSIGDQITKLITNYKKANLQQKSKKAYVAQKVKEAQELFGTFEANHKSIVDHKDVDRSVHYFQVQYFEAIASLYDTSIVTMINQLDSLGAEGSNSMDNKINEGLTLMKLQKQAVKDFRLKLERLSTKPLLEKEQWLEILKGSLSVIKCRADNIFLQLEDYEDVPDDISSEVIYELESQLITQISSVKSSLNTARSEAENGHLMNVEIKPFNGDYLKWPVFKNLFIEMVHTQKYSDTVKVAHLHKLLVEEAATVLGQADLSKESYQDTWTRIQEAYDNKEDRLQ